MKQLGLRNYAGPNCPGAGWNCTSSTRVLQATSPGGQNVAECTGSAVMNPCVISQAGEQNTARCTQKSTTTSSATQSCTITQTGATNIAYVTQTLSQSDGSTQYGSQAASVTQTGSALNQLQLIQDASQTMKTGVEQLQNLYQSAVVKQLSSAAVNNTSSIYQSQLQKEYAKSTLQKQNYGGGDGLGDCFPAETPTKPNACANVTQVSVGGNNDNHLKQFVSEDQNSTGSADQFQGADGGGLDGRVHQETSGSGSSLNQVNQSKALKQTVPKGGGSNQTQIDPVRCCGTFSQLGGAGNSETINQASSLSASQPGASQSSSIIGESRTPDGTCTVSQKASINGDSDTNSASHSPCPLLIVETSCSGGSESSTCTAQPPVFGEPNSSLVKGVRNVNREEFDYLPSTNASTNQTVDFKITYSNTGTVDAHSVTITDVVPAGLSYEGCRPEGSCAFDGDTNTVTWNLGTVPPDESVDVFFLADVTEQTSGTTITNTASALTKEEGPGAASGSASVVVVNPPISGLTIGVRNITQGDTAFSSTTDAVTDDVLEYEIIYTNTGGSPAHNVTVTAPVPVQTTVNFPGSVASCPYSGGFDAGFTTLTCVLGPGTDPGTIAPGDLLSLRRVTYMAKVTVPLSFCGTFPATASVVTDETGTVSTTTPANVDTNGAPLCIG